MTDDDGSIDGEDQTGQGSDRQDTRHPSIPAHDWENWLDAVRMRVQEQIAIWPEKVSETIDLVDLDTSSDVPSEGDILIYVHGYLGEGRLHGMNVSGANQAAALRKALADEFEGTGASSPTVVAGTWNSSTTWPRAKERAVTAGRNLAHWVSTNGDDYERVTITGHSLGGRVTLTALDALDYPVDSVGLLGAAVLPETVYSAYRDGIESAVDGEVFNYYSRNDFVVCRLYSFREGNDGIGCHGTSAETGRSSGELPANYVDVDVSETVHGHLDYFKPLPETAVGNCVGELVEKQLRTHPSSPSD